MQIEELMNKRKALEDKLTKLETKEQHTQLKSKLKRVYMERRGLNGILWSFAVDDLTEKIMDETDQDESTEGTPRPPRYSLEDESDEEYDFGECFKVTKRRTGEKDRDLYCYVCL